MCRGYSDSNCCVRDACWCLDPVGLCAGGARWVYKQTTCTVGGATWWAGALTHCLCFSSSEFMCFVLFCFVLCLHGLRSFLSTGSQCSGTIFYDKLILYNQCILIPPFFCPPIPLLDETSRQNTTSGRAESNAKLNLRCSSTAYSALSATYFG